MTMEQKLEWLKNATNEQLLEQLTNMVWREATSCSFGERAEDIDLAKKEILNRMTK